LGKKLHILGYILVYFGGNFSFISSKVLITIYNGFWHKGLQHNSCNISNEINFLTKCFFSTHLCSFEWKTCLNVFCEITWDEMLQSIHIQYIINYFIKFCNYLNHLKSIFALCSISWQHLNSHNFFNHLILIKNVVSFENCIIWLLNYLILSIIYKSLFEYWLDGSWKLHSFEK
jgi:hypothetical protein